MLIFCVLFFLIGVFLWVKITQNYEIPTNHVNLFSISWTFMLIGAFVFPLEISIRPMTYFILICSWIFFLLGSFTLKSKNEYRISTPVNYNFKRIRIVLYFLICLSIIAYLSSLGDVISQITNVEAWASVRSEKTFAEATQENIFYTLFARNYDIYIPIAVYLFVKNEISKKIFYTIIAYGVLTSVINFSRAPLFELLMVLFVSIMLINQSLKIPIFKILFFIAGFVLLFTFSQSVLFSLNDYSVFDAGYQIKMYLFGGVNNYQLILDGLYPDNKIYSSPYYSFDFINYILKRLDIIYSYPEQIREFNEFTESNVYTYLDAFTLDFGIVGAFIGSYIFGFIGKKMYFSYQSNKSLFSLIIYSLFCYYSVMAFINNEFVRFSFLLFILKAYLIVEIIRFPFKSRPVTVK